MLLLFKLAEVHKTLVLLFICVVKVLLSFKENRIWDLRKHPKGAESQLSTLHKTPICRIWLCKHCQTLNVRQRLKKKKKKRKNNVEGGLRQNETRGKKK